MSTLSRQPALYLFSPFRVILISKSMIPLRDTIRSRTIPFVNLTIIALNALVFLFELSLSPRGLDRFTLAFGMVPARLGLGSPLALLSNPLPLITLFTHMFLHGGWLHFLSNMWTLFIFGDNVEDRMGHARYFIFYILAGLASGLLQAFAMTGSNIPAIGASGAIAGVLGAYFILYPAGRVLTLIPLFIFPWFVEIPALIYLGFWFVTQLFSGIASLNVAGSANMGGVAWWAHIGGFVFGVFAYRFFLRRLPPSPYTYYQGFPEDRL
jgi:membrane associated rhomboid family serine protease